MYRGKTAGKRSSPKEKFGAAKSSAPNTSVDQVKCEAMQDSFDEFRGRREKTVDKRKIPLRKTILPNAASPQRAYKPVHAALPQE
jgi:hypothetical protein